MLQVTVNILGLFNGKSNNRSYASGGSKWVGEALETHRLSVKVLWFSCQIIDCLPFPWNWRIFRLQILHPSLHEIIKLIQMNDILERLLHNDSRILKFKKNWRISVFYCFFCGNWGTEKELIVQGQNFQCFLWISSTVIAFLFTISRRLTKKNWLEVNNNKTHHVSP